MATYGSVSKIRIDVPDEVAIKAFYDALKPGGVLTLEFPHLLELITHNQFDTIYHEHYSYLSLTAMQRIFAANGLVVSADGTYVTDERLKLIWARCVEGMAWDGKTCTGKPLMLDRAEARARAVERWKAEGVNWRLPRVPELQRLFNKSAQPPGLDLTVFPAAPLDWTWTSTSPRRPS